MKYFNILLLFASIFIFSCQNAEKGGPNVSDSDSLIEARTDSGDNQIPTFEFKHQPSKEMSDDEIMNSLADRYVSESGNNNACDCGEKTCYKPKLLTKHYFKQNDKTKALAVIGNNCSSENASRVHLGWCDIALFEQNLDGKWEVKNFWQEVGGGADWGMAGDAGEPIQIANEGIGIPIGWGSTAQGYTYEGVEILGYYDGKTQSVGKIQVHMDNAGAAFDENDMECTCTSYTFKPNAASDSYDLVLTRKDCKNSEGCDGEVLKKVTVAMGDDKYDIPKDFNLW